MVQQTAEEAKKATVAKMGEPLGELFSALWQDVAIIFVYWKEYVELFGTKPARIALLNQAAPAFFHMLQDQLWEMSLLHLARLTDPANSMGNPDKSNLTVQGLPALVDDARLKAEVTKLVSEAVRLTEFARDWRNRRIAHRDLKLALEQPTTPLADGSRAQVKEALEALASVLNALAHHYLKSQTRFDLGGRLGGAISLLYIISGGLKAQEARGKRLEAGKPTPEDLEVTQL
jgi:hypothetical protein